MAIGTPTSAGTGVDTTLAGSSSSFTTSASITAANLLVVAVLANTGNSVSVTGVTVGTDTLTKAASVVSDTFDEGSLWYKENASAQSSGVTVTITYSGAAGGGVATFIVGQVSGIKTSSALDKTGTGAGSGSTASASTGTLSQSNEIVFGAATAVGNVTGYSAPSGFTNVAGATNANTFGELDYKIVSSTGSTTYSPTFTSGPGVRNTAIVASFIGIAASFIPRRQPPRFFRRSF